MQQHNLSNKEERDQVVGWLKTYSLPIIIAIIIGLGGNYVYRTWQARQELSVEGASNLFAASQVMAYEGNTAELANYTTELVNKYPHSNYASMGQLLKAQQLAAAKQYDAANASVNWVLSNSKDAVMLDMANFSAAGILLQQNKGADALVTLDKISPIFAPAVWEQKALAYQAMNQPAQAVAALEKAKQLYAAVQVPNPLLNILLAQYPTKV